MSVQLTVAVISALVAVASIFLSARTTRSNTHFQAQLQRENGEFHARLQDELQQRRDQESKAARLEEVVGRYRDPLLSAAFELQSRIYNFVRRGFTGYLRLGDEDEKRYAVTRPGTAIGVCGVSAPRVQFVSWAGSRLRSSLRGARGWWPRGHGAMRVRQRDQSEARPGHRWWGPVKPAITHCLRPGLLTPVRCQNWRTASELGFYPRHSCSSASSTC